MSRVTIPKGRQIEFLKDGKSILPGVPLTLESDLTISVSSSFDYLMGGGGKYSKLISNIGKSIASVAGSKFGFGGTLKQMGVQTWQSTDPLSLNVVLTFFLGMRDIWNALEEVKKPIFELMKMTLPTEGALGTLVAPGPSPLDVLKGTAADGMLKTATISLDIGGIIYLPEIIVKQVQPTFSKEVDENGFPIWGQVSIDVMTLFTATGDLLDDEITASMNSVYNRGQGEH